MAAALYVFVHNCIYNVRGGGGARRKICRQSERERAHLSPVRLQQRPISKQGEHEISLLYDSPQTTPSGNTYPYPYPSPLVSTSPACDIEM